MGFLKKIDWKINLAILFLLSCGLVSLSSAKPDLFYKQLLFTAVGLFLCYIFFKFDWRSFVNFKGVIFGIYALSIFFLILTLAIAPQVRGTRSWIPLGPFQFQTSTFAALALIIVLANFFKKEHKAIARPANIIKSFIYFSIPAGLILLQPDMGSALLLFLIWFGFILVSGIPLKRLSIILIVLLIVGNVMWFGFMENYQKERVMGLFSPGEDVLGINYNVVQSKVAIGSAGFFGKGFKQGTQVQLGFLPEAQTDFIFAAIIEEWGLISGFLIIVAFVFLTLRIINIGMEEKGNFNRFICLGTVIFFCANFIFNTGSNIGLMPVVGVPFPFLSYGGSHLLIEFILIGMIQSIWARR